MFIQEKKERKKRELGEKAKEVATSTIAIAKDNVMKMEAIKDLEAELIIFDKFLSIYLRWVCIQIRFACTFVCEKDTSKSIGRQN